MWTGRGSGCQKGLLEGGPLVPSLCWLGPFWPLEQALHTSTPSLHRRKLQLSMVETPA